MNYKWCAVPNCTNTTIKTPHKLFLTVPKNEKVRKTWLQLARRDPNKIKSKSVIFFCEDHFNLEKDMANFYQYGMGYSQKILLRAGVVPTKFYCQEGYQIGSKTSASKLSFINRLKTHLIKECQHAHVLKVLTEASPSHTKPTAMPVQNVKMATATTQKTDVDPKASKNEDIAEERPDSRSDTLSASPVEDFEIKTENLYEDMEDMSMYEDYATSAAEPDVVKTKEENLYHILQCNVCNEEITGFRYTCVQCSDFDLCSSCETNKAHHHHYVLRVPHPTPNEELEAVLTVIRLHLLKDLDPIKDPEPETIIVKIEETTEESILPGELVEEEDKPEEMDKIIHARVPQTEQDTCSVDANKSASYKCCAVPMCLNTTVKTPKKLFINVPTRKSVRDNWLKLARRDPTTVNRISTLHFCQDHFDLPNDMVNYMQYHIMGSVSQIRMKSGCVPSKFDCHPDWGRLSAQELYILEKQRKLMIQDCDGEPHGIGATNTIIMEPTISKTADKWIQVYFKRSKFRSKATQTRNKVVTRATSPFKIESFTDNKPYRGNSRRGRKRLRN